MDFRWNQWNVERLASHGIDPEEAQDVVVQASGPYPRRIGDDKLPVWGPGRGGRLLQVVFVLDDDGTVFVIHARALTNRENESIEDGSDHEEWKGSQKKHGGQVRQDDR